MSLVATSPPLPEPDGDQDCRDRHEEERLHERSYEPSVGDYHYPCERSHSPPTV